jgi:two-component system LytT family response regulator
VKPIVHQELYDAIKRFQKNVQTSNNQDKIQNALLNLKEEKIEDQRLLLQTQKGSLRIALKRIIKIEGDRNYSLIHLSDGLTELSSKTLGYFEEILSEKGFFRCHRSYLVNRMHIESIIDQGSFLLKNRKKVPISRRKMNEAKHWFHS